MTYVRFSPVHALCLLSSCGLAADGEAVWGGAVKALQGAERLEVKTSRESGGLDYVITDPEVIRRLAVLLNEKAVAKPLNAKLASADYATLKVYDEPEGGEPLLDATVVRESFIFRRASDPGSTYIVRLPADELFRRLTTRNLEFPTRQETGT